MIIAEVVGNVTSPVHMGFLDGRTLLLVQPRRISPRSPRRQQFRVPRVQTLRPNEQHEMVVAPATGPFTVAKFW